MKRKVLLVEDDHIQRAYLQRELESGADAAVEAKSCEWEFQRDFEAVARDPPDVAVIDVMLRWASPSPDMQTPPPGTTPVEAGLRCAAKLRADARTESVKVILYSVLPRASSGETALPGDAIYLVKELECQDLIEEVNKVPAVR